MGAFQKEKRDKKDKHRDRSHPNRLDETSPSGPKQCDLGKDQHQRQGYGVFFARKSAYRQDREDRVAQNSISDSPSPRCQINGKRGEIKQTGEQGHSLPDVHDHISLDRMDKENEPDQEGGNFHVSLASLRLGTRCGQNQESQYHRGDGRQGNKSGITQSERKRAHPRDKVVHIEGGHGERSLRKNADNVDKTAAKEVFIALESDQGVIIHGCIEAGIVNCDGNDEGQESDYDYRKRLLLHRTSLSSIESANFEPACWLFDELGGFLQTCNIYSVCLNQCPIRGRWSLHSGAGRNPVRPTV